MTWHGRAGQGMEWKSTLFPSSHCLPVAELLVWTVNDVACVVALSAVCLTWESVRACVCFVDTHGWEHGIRNRSSVSSCGSSCMHPLTHSYRESVTNQYKSNLAF